MHTLHSKIYSFIFTLVAVLLVASCAQYQEQSGVKIMATRGQPAWEGTVAGQQKPFARNNDDLRIAVLTQPVPEVWLEFAESKRKDQSSPTPTDEKEPVIKLGLPSEAQEIFKSFWEKSLEFDYKDVFDQPKTPQESYDRDMAWTSYILTTRQQLQKIEIAAPDGARKISAEEAKDLVAFLRKASGDLVMSVQ